MKTVQFTCKRSVVSVTAVSILLGWVTVVAGMQVMPTGVLQTLQSQPLKESGPDPSVAGLIAAIQTMNDLMLRYR